ncbi:MAG: Nramp family divalent metal transporter [Acidobacteria bacterium]|nr:Nramp family divalent metal transporter [Acidobacteriota bacterium]MCL5286622.1 Nramp family divalent metal transporter [Acidobacteriota bacterium]
MTPLRQKLGRFGEWVLHSSPAQRARRMRRRLVLLLAVVGPGVIVSNVNNEAGGIYTYSLAGAQFGYSVLWALVPMGFALFVTEEMCARMGAVTGKGLSDLIREEFGFRVTFFVMLAVLVVNQGNVLAEFAGVASAMTLFGVSKYISVPIAALLVWLLVLEGSSRWLEKIFMFFCLVYFAYVVSAFFAKPHWLIAALNLLPTPVLQYAPGFKQWVSPVPFTTAYLLILAGLIGSTIAPWQHFYVQAAVVEKRVGPRQYRQTRTDVMVGTITAVIIIFFIIVCTATTLNAVGHHTITDAGEAAQGLVPLAGKWAGALFAIGLLNASLFAASILPLSTAYVICEGLGFESGVDRKWKEAPIFYWLYTGMIVSGAAIILWPQAPLVLVAVLSQVANGILLPFVLVFILLLVNRKDLMGEQTNSRTYNALAWGTTVTMVVITLVLVYLALFTPSALHGAPAGR